MVVKYVEDSFPKKAVLNILSSAIIMIIFWGLLFFGIRNPLYRLFITVAIVWGVAFVGIMAHLFLTFSPEEKTKAVSKKYPLHLFIRLAKDTLLIFPVFYILPKVQQYFFGGVEKVAGEVLVTSLDYSLFSILLTLTVIFASNIHLVIGVVYRIVKGKKAEVFKVKNMTYTALIIVGIFISISSLLGNISPELFVAGGMFIFLVGGVKLISLMLESFGGLKYD